MGWAAAVKTLRAKARVAFPVVTLLLGEVSAVRLPRQTPEAHARSLSALVSLLFAAFFFLAVINCNHA